jgi:proteic killer suppression protein
MIKSFAHKGLEDFFYDGTLKGIQAKHAPRLRLILDLLDSAEASEQMNFPGSVLHPLKGSLKGHWSVRVSGNWRVTFRFENGDAYIVNYQDYH